MSMFVTRLTIGMAMGLVLLGGAAFAASPASAVISRFGSEHPPVNLGQPVRHRQEPVKRPSQRCRTVRHLIGRLPQQICGDVLVGCRTVSSDRCRFSAISHSSASVSDGQTVASGIVGGAARFRSMASIISSAISA